MRLRHIEIFHAIYTTGSITNAANMLHVSQPSVSKVLAHAEIRLGFKLFERIKGRLVPTDEADMLFVEADKIYQQMRSIKNTAQNIKNIEYGNVSLAITPALGFEVAPKAIAAFHRDFPQVNFNIQTVHNDAVSQALLEHKCDLALVFAPSSLPNIAMEPFAESELVVVYPRVLFPEMPTELSLAQIEQFEFIDIADSGPLGDLLWNRMMADNKTLSSVIKVQTYFIAAKLVDQGVGVCVIDKFTALGNLTPNMGMASFKPEINFSVGALQLENKQLPKVTTQFLSYVKQAILS